MDRYKYDGPVIIFGRCVRTHWKGETIAASEEKARNNLAYQCKKQINLGGGGKVELPGKITRVG